MKYLGVKLDEHLTWKPHIDGISAKLNKANAMYFVDKGTLKPITMLYLNQIYIIIF